MLGNVPFLCSPVLLHLSNTEEVISNYSFGFCLMLLLYLEILLFMRKRTHSLNGSESPNLFLSNILKRLQGGYGRWGSEDGGWACSLLTNCNACFEDKAWLCWLYTNKLVLWPALCLSCPRFCFFLMVCHHFHCSSWNLFKSPLIFFWQLSETLILAGP